MGDRLRDIFGPVEENNEENMEAEEEPEEEQEEKEGTSSSEEEEEEDDDEPDPWSPLRQKSWGRYPRTLPERSPAVPG